MAVYRAHRAGGEGELHVTLQIEPGNLLLTRSGSRTEGIVEIYLAQIQPSGKRSVAGARRELRPTGPVVQKVVEEGLRVVVRDAHSGAAGTLRCAHPVDSHGMIHLRTECASSFSSWRWRW